MSATLRICMAVALLWCIGDAIVFLYNTKEVSAATHGLTLLVTLLSGVVLHTFLPEK
jgi:hypothetical protein